MIHGACIIALYSGHCGSNINRPEYINKGKVARERARGIAIER